PGPPRELQEMWPRALAAPPARDVLGRAEPYRTMSIRMFGIPESELAQALRGIEEDGVELDKLEVTTCLRGGELVTDVRHREGAEGAAEALRAGLAERLGPFIFTETGESVEEVVFRLLGDRAIAVAESESGGLLAGRLTLRPGSSQWFAGG